MLEIASATGRRRGHAAAVRRAADSACYAAKSDGRNRIEIYHADPAYEACDRFNLVELRRT